MKWLIKNPAPLDFRLKKWGDYHFGRCLTKYLKRLGQDVDTDYDSQWNNDKQADVVLVIRGRHPYEVKPGPINIIWHISHSEDVDIEEYASYDLVFIASKEHAKLIRERINVPVMELLQCTDTEEFCIKDPEMDDERADIIFVGNTRNVERPSVKWAVEHGIPVKIWGSGWSKFIDADKFVVGEHIRNEDLGDLYCRSRATLNDHWPDMKRHGFINNRIFDALACGLPVISDYHRALHELFPSEILYFTAKDEFRACFDELILDYPSVKARINKIQDRIHQEFSFEARAKSLVGKAIR